VSPASDGGRANAGLAPVQPARQGSQSRVAVDATVARLLARSSSEENLPRRAKDQAFGFDVVKLARSNSDQDLRQVADALSSPRPPPPATEHIPVVYRPF